MTESILDRHMPGALDKALAKADYDRAFMIAREMEVVGQTPRVSSAAVLAMYWEARS